MMLIYPLKDNTQMEKLLGLQLVDYPEQDEVSASNRPAVI